MLFSMIGTVLSWTLFSLVLLIIIPDRWNARREIAKRQRQYAENPAVRARAATKGSR